MVMSDILLEINQRQWADPVYQSNVSEHYWVSQHITWVDDSAFVVQSEAPLFVEAVSKRCSISLMSWQKGELLSPRCSIPLMYGQGKTAIIMTFQGKDAGKYKRKFEQEHGHQLHLLTEHFGLTKVPIVMHYKHYRRFLSAWR